MIARNSKVKIVASSQLTEMMLEELVGKTGVVSEDLTGPERRGCKGIWCFSKTRTKRNTSGSSPPNRSAMRKEYPVSEPHRAVARWGCRSSMAAQRLSQGGTQPLPEQYRGVAVGYEAHRVDSTTMAVDVNALRLRVDEYKRLRAEDAEKIRRLGVKIKHLEAAARHEVEVADR